MIEPVFPAVWDNSIRSTFVTCPRLGFYSHILHLRKRAGKSIHLHFGGCIAKGLEVTRKAYWRDEKNELDAIAEGVKAAIVQWDDYEMPPELERTRSSVKDLAGCIDALVSYFEQHQLGNDPIRPLKLDGKFCIENTFCFPVMDTAHPETGETIQYAGRFDMLATYQDAIFVVDEKTTLQLGPTWRSNWVMRGQFSGYALGARTLLPERHAVAGCIVRGIGIMKGPITFETAILTRPQWQIDQWLRQLQLDIEQAYHAYRIMKTIFKDEPHLAWSQNLDSACSSYGGCAYMGLCDSPDPHPWYDEYFVEQWNPLEQRGE